VTRGDEEVGCGSVDEEEVESEGRVSIESRWRLDWWSCRFWVGDWVVRKRSGGVPGYSDGSGPIIRHVHSSDYC